MWKDKLKFVIHSSAILFMDDRLALINQNHKKQVDNNSYNCCDF